MTRGEDATGHTRGDGGESENARERLRAWGMTPLRRIPSRKNSVYLVQWRGRPVIVKLFGTDRAEAFRCERQILAAAREHGISVPAIQHACPDQALVLDYIQGENLCDVVEREGALGRAAAIAAWYAGFHRTFGEPDGQVRIKGDSILHNFVVDEQDRLWGLDFEESVPGRPEQDLGEICASLLNTDPMFTGEKQRACRHLLEHYHRLTGWGDPGQVDLELARALELAARWRPQQQAYLRQQAERIRREGLLSAGQGGSEYIENGDGNSRQQ
jgi:hypothetical protein